MYILNYSRPIVLQGNIISPSVLFVFSVVEFQNFHIPYFFKEMTCKYVILASFCIEFCWLRICSLLVSPILNSQSGFLEIFRIHKNNFLFASKQPLRKKTGIGETMWWIVWKCIICQFIYSKLTPYESLMSSSDSFTNFLMYCQFK